MQFMQMLKASLVPRRSIIATVVMVGVVATVLGVMPTHGASNTLAETCANPPSTPTFNYWPVTYDDANTPLCHDFPAIDAAIDGADSHWSKSEADWNDGLTLNVGDAAAASMYLHNGAANNLDPAQTTAKNVHIITKTDTTVGATHKITVTYTADNAASYTKSFTINTPADAQLQVVSNSGNMYDYKGRLILDQQNLNIGNSDFALGDLDACFEYSIFLTFKFKVVRATVDHEREKIEIKKVVKNNSNSTSYSDSVDAKTGERVNFKVTVTNPGTSTLNNVVMTDVIPDGLKFDDSVTGDGTPSFNNNTFTVNFGTILGGKSKTVEFAAKVTTDSKNTICNIAKAKADNVREVQDDACVKVIVRDNNPGSPNIVLSKRAWNDTKNVDATTVNADRGDYITYSLVTMNNGSATKSDYVIKDDLSAVLAFADIVSTNGGTVSGNVISYPATNISAGETVVKTFKVRVKQTLNQNQSFQLRNTYGNTIVINVPGKVVYQAPKTGAAGTSAATFAGLVTAGFVVMRKRGSILKFIFA